MHGIKRWVFLVHRWLGIVVCAFFAMWFVSGVVMMYVGYPKLTSSERLAHLPVLEASAGTLGPREALDRAGIAGPLRELRLLASRGGQPVYLAVPLDGAAPAGQRRAPPGAGTVAIDAFTGAVLREVGRAEALASAAAYAGTPSVPMEYEGSVDEDALTHSRGLDAHRPLHRVQLHDLQGTRLYISGTTGEVVRDATRTERSWNYAGAWIHWLYPFRGNAFDGWWAGIVNGLSIAGIAVALTGMVIGVLRWRFTRRYRSGSRSPYQGALMRWHHVAGLLFGLATLTWVFSGLMSMNPWKVLDSAAPPLRTQAMDGGPLQVAPTAASPGALLATAGPSIRELRWTRTTGRNLVLASHPAGRPVVLDAATAAVRVLDRSETLAAAALLVPAPVKAVETLDAYDLYYYQRAPHTMTGGGDKPLPVVRIRFDDPHQTWVHLDPVTGAVIGRSDRARRTGRWLFAMLHSWDWLPLLDRRPLWDVLMVLLSAGGAALSLTGVVIGWKRLGRKLGRPAARR